MIDAPERKSSIRRFDVLGVEMSAINLRIATDAILEALAKRQKGYVCLRDVHGVVRAQSDPEFRRILNAAFLNTPDGMPLVWLGRRAVGSFVDRVYGPDLMLEVFAATEHTEYRHFFYGGAPGVAEELKARMQCRFPRTTICGVYCPPFRRLNEAEESEFISLIKETRPDIVWVGLSTPKQEYFMAEYLPKLDTTIMCGVGAAFDFHSGRVKQAPRWIQRSGFEWLYRMMTEPKRLGRRYLTTIPVFLWLMWKNEKLKR